MPQYAQRGSWRSLWPRPAVSPPIYHPLSSSAISLGSEPQALSTQAVRGLAAAIEGDELEDAIVATERAAPLPASIGTYPAPCPIQQDTVEDHGKLDR